MTIDDLDHQTAGTMSLEPRHQSVAPLESHSGWEPGTIYQPQRQNVSGSGPRLALQNIRDEGTRFASDAPKRRHEETDSEEQARWNAILAEKVAAHLGVLVNWERGCMARFGKTWSGGEEALKHAAAGNSQLAAIALMKEADAMALGFVAKTASEAEMAMYVCALWWRGHVAAVLDAHDGMPSGQTDGGIYDLLVEMPPGMWQIAGCPPSLQESSFRPIPYLQMIRDWFESFRKMDEMMRLGLVALRGTRAFGEVPKLFGFYGPEQVTVERVRALIRSAGREDRDQRFVALATLWLVEHDLLRINWMSVKPFRWIPLLEGGQRSRVVEQLARVKATIVDASCCTVEVTMMRTGHAHFGRDPRLAELMAGLPVCDVWNPRKVTIKATPGEWSGIIAVLEDLLAGCDKVDLPRWLEGLLSALSSGTAVAQTAPAPWAPSRAYRREVDLGWRPWLPGKPRSKR